MAVRWLLKLLYWLGLMRTAVGLLALAALVSLVGTVLPQGLPVQDYVVEFGPIFARVLWGSGLTDVFRAWWFLAVLGLVMASVAVCLLRNGPLIYKQIFLPRQVPGAAKRAFWAPDGQRLGTDWCRCLRKAGFRRVGVVEGYEVWQRGVGNRVGYFLVHMGVLGVALAGLLTGFLGWRGTLNLREGEADHVALVWHGAVAEPKFLPFDVRNEGFEIEQYPSGMPKRYASHLRFEGPRGPGSEERGSEVARGGGQFSLRGPASLVELRGASAGNSVPSEGGGPCGGEGGYEGTVRSCRGGAGGERFAVISPFAFKENLESSVTAKRNAVLSRGAGGEGEASGVGGVVKTVEVNKPVSYGDYTFYQASFGDGGSQVRGVGVGLADGAVVPFAGRVYDKALLADGTRIELLEFRPFTVETLPGMRPTDVGPSVDYLVQPPDAPARQLRAFLNHPGIVGVAEGEKTVAGARSVVYRPVLLGIEDDALWPLVARVVRGEDYKTVVAPVLGRMRDERVRVEAGLAVMNAAKLVRELGLTHLLVLRDFDLKRYSGLQVAYDPAVNLFWLAAALLLLGVVLMLGRRMVRVWVKGDEILVTSPHGVKVAAAVWEQIAEGRDP